jgi:hypothetical protein
MPASHVAQRGHLGTTVAHPAIGRRRSVARDADQEVVRTGSWVEPPEVGQPMFTVRRRIRVEQPELLIPKIDPPSDALAKPHCVSSRNEPNFSRVGF